MDEFTLQRTLHERFYPTIKTALELVYLHLHDLITQKRKLNSAGARPHFSNYLRALVWVVDRRT